MKLRVIGWTDYDKGLPQGDNGWAARNAIIDEIVRCGYDFSGWAHQECDDCAPVLNDGKMYCFSQRGWGDLMAEAHGNMGPLGYTGYMYASEHEHRPNKGLGRFVPETELSETFEVSVSEKDFDEAAGGKLRLYDYQGLRYLYNGDTLVLRCGERSAAMIVKRVERVRDIEQERLGRIRAALASPKPEIRKRAREEYENTKLVLEIELVGTSP